MQRPGASTDFKGLNCPSGVTIGSGGCLGRNIGTLSTLAVLPNSESSWKQEVCRRVAAHRSRVGLSTEKPAKSVQSRQKSGSRAAQIAARVAARYAQAPSYSQMHVEAIAARIAVQEALPEPLEASAGAFLGEFDAVQAKTPEQPSTQACKPDAVPVQLAVSPSLEAWESEDFRRIPEPDFALSLPETVSASASVRAPRPVLANGSSGFKDHEPAVPLLFTYANLIEFPRELVAPRKRRPRRAEGPFAAEGPLASDGLERQWSIFEVDPGALSMQPETAVAAPAWSSPEWASIELEAQPTDEPEPEEPETAAVSLPDLRRASIGLRMRSALVDGALVAAAVLGSAVVAAVSIGLPLPAGIARLSALSGLLLAGLLYLTIFLILDEATPGMRCSGLSLYTLDGQLPTRPQRCARMGALLLSLLPAGLGAAWILFDDDHLSWRDRLSKTYLRKG